MIEDFIEQSNRCENIDSLLQLYREAIKQLGFEKLTYTFMTDHYSVGQQAGHNIQSNYPEEWLTYYSEKRLYNVDPTITKALNFNQAFAWQEVTDSQFISPEQKLMMLQAQESGLLSGISVPLHRGNGEIAGIGLASDTLMDIDKNTLSRIKLLSEQFHMVYCELISRQSPTQQTVTLTKREEEVLKWYIAGKSKSVIADILYCSESNIRFHLKNCYKKFNVHDKFGLIAKAVRHGYIPFDRIGINTIFDEPISSYR